jgi:hypothetical protein
MGENSPYLVTLNCFSVHSDSCSQKKANWGQRYDHNFRRFWPVFCKKMSTFFKSNVISLIFVHKLLSFFIKVDNFCENIIFYPFFLRGSVIPFPIGFCYRQVATLLHLLSITILSPPYHQNTWTFPLGKLALFLKNNVMIIFCRINCMQFESKSTFFSNFFRREYF